jgi:hypothetical protein
MNYPCTYCQQPMLNTVIVHKLQQYICDNARCPFRQVNTIMLIEQEVVVYTLWYPNDQGLFGSLILNLTEVRLRQDVQRLMKTNFIPLHPDNYAPYGEVLIPKLLKLSSFA